jgi:hypothetical protein
LSGIVLCVSQLVAIGWFALHPDDNQERLHRFMVVGPIIYTLFLTLYLWLLAVWLRTRLHLDAERVVSTGVTSSVTVDFKNVLQLEWLVRDLRLETASTKCRLDISDFASAEQAQIVHHLHRVIPLERQVNWELFATRFFRTLTPREARQNALIGFGLFLVGGLVFVGSGMLRGRTDLLTLSPLPFLGAAYCLWRSLRVSKTVAAPLPHGPEVQK